ncbi:MAG: hypothetical protein OEW52_00185 [Thermoleophilia bacterium]|nr:hypothetical protein [Thermoleophilia bacterium]
MKYRAALLAGATYCLAFTLWGVGERRLDWLNLALDFLILAAILEQKGKQ